MPDFHLIEGEFGDATALLAERQKRVDRFVLGKRAEAVTYYASRELIAAVDVALTLGRPLLLTGEPGSGKTLAASWLAYKLGLMDDGHFHEFQVRSDSRARDTCYDFDAVSWFRQSQLAGGEVDKKKFVTPRALGKAFGWRNNEDDDKPHLVLIDEIDKAPRDFPNDLLLELDEMRFAIAETGEQIGPSKKRPIVVITSNSERRLPDPFLRRCVTHKIEITPRTVEQILAARLASYDGAKADAKLIAAASAFWERLTELAPKLVRKPSIAEYWQWLALATNYPTPQSPDLIAVLPASPASLLTELPYIRSLLTQADLDFLAK